METTLKVYRRVEETIPLYGWPEMDKVVAFDAEQRKEGGYKVEITIRYAGGPEIGIDVYHHEPSDLRIQWREGDGDPLADWDELTSLDMPLYPGSGLTVFDLQRDARNFAENHFFRLREEDGD